MKKDPLDEPLTVEEQQFATDNHYLVYKYLRSGSGASSGTAGAANTGGGGGGGGGGSRTSSSGGRAEGMGGSGGTGLVLIRIHSSIRKVT